VIFLERRELTEFGFLRASGGLFLKVLNELNGVAAGYLEALEPVGVSHRRFALL
jgi:hypothetical protein